MQTPAYAKAYANSSAYDSLPASTRALIDPGSRLDYPIRLTTFPTQGAQRKREVFWSLNELAAEIENTKAADKARLPWVKGARFGDKRTPLRPDPARPGKKTGNSLRHDANVRAVTAVELDYDAGDIPPEEARDRLERAAITALVYTTPSHGQPGKGNRWRVLAPCSEEVPPERRASYVARLNGVLGGEVDGASFTLSQAFYYGNVTGKTPVRTFPIEGHRYVDQAEDLDASAIGKRSRSRANDNSSFDEAGLLDDILTGANYHGSAMSLIGRWSDQGVCLVECRRRLREAFDAAPEPDRRPEWAERRASIPTMLDHVFGKRFAEYEDLTLLLTDDDVAEDGRLTFTTPAECSLADARRYVIKGLLAEGDVACFVGAPGVGKSLLAPRLGYAVAQGQDIFGMRVRQGGVFYVAAEDQHGMRGRVAALRQQHGEADDFVLVGGVSNLLSDDLDALKTAVERRRPSLIFIDTLAIAFPALEENSSEGMGRVVAAARSLTQWGAAVVLIHHDTKDGQQGLPRGHSILNGALDVSLHVTKTDGIIRAKLTKNRNGSQDQDIAFTIGTRVLGVDEDAEPIHVAVCQELGPIVERQEHLSPSAAAALDLLPSVMPQEQWREACIASMAVTSAEKRSGKVTQFNRAFTDLRAKGRVVVRDGYVCLPDYDLV